MPSAFYWPLLVPCAPAGLRRQLTSSLALAQGSAYSTHVKNPVFVVANFSKVVFAFGFVPVTLGFVLALVQVRFSGYAAGFGWLLCGLGF